MINLLKKIPFFLLLLPVFFCLHGSLENFGYLELNEVLLIGVVILAWIALFFGVSWLLVRNYVLVSLTVFFISTWYLFFGAIHDWVKSVKLLSFVSGFSVLLPLLIIITVGWIIFLKRRRTISLKLVYYLNILLLVYCLVDGTLLLNKQFSSQKKPARTVAFDNSRVTAKPNVYFMLFDEYPGYQSLKDSFGFANDSLYHFLQKKEFSILPVYSNYDFTLFSMSAILNMQYVDPGYDPKNVSQRELQIRTDEIRNGEVFRIFKNMGYDIQNFSVFDIGGTHAIADQNALLPVHSMLITDKILHKRVIRSSGWLFQTGKWALPSWRKKYLYQHETNNLLAQKKLLETAAEKSKAPVFCYAHFMMPHWPFYNDSTGSPNSDTIIANSGLLNDKALFLSYLKYTNSVIEKLVDTITANDPGAIVVVMSDHGFRSYKNTNEYEPFNFDNICAVRSPQKDYRAERPKWSAVNFFRYLFNTQFGQHIPYLGDSSIVLRY